MSRLRWHCCTEASSADVRQRWTPDALRGGTGGSLGAMSLCVTLTFTHPPACALQALGHTLGPGLAAPVLTGTGTYPGEVLQGRSPGAHRLDAEVLGKHWSLVYFRWEAQCRVTVLKTQGLHGSPHSVCMDSAWEAGPHIQFVPFPMGPALWVRCLGSPSLGRLLLHI